MEIDGIYNCIRIEDMDIMNNLFSVVDCPKCYYPTLILIENKKQGSAFLPGISSKTNLQEV